MTTRLASECAPNQLSGGGKADGDRTLWAGLTSYAFERDPQDPCDSERNSVGDSPIIWDEYVRERAEIRNVCFQVWSPGITDTNDPNYWQELDVQVHYRMNGASDWKTAYVRALDHRGNNLRYAWSLDFSADPFFNVASLVELGAPRRAEVAVRKPVHAAVRRRSGRARAHR